MNRIISWWKELGYMNYRRGALRIFGIRPWGKRWFMLVIDDTDTAKKNVQ